MQVASVGQGYFDAMGVSLLRGRSFDEPDRESGASTLIVSAAAVRRYWPGADPIGRTVRIGAASTPAHIIGVASDVKVQTLGEEPQAFVYQPLTRGHAGLLRLVVRMRGDSARAPDELRRVVRELDPNVAVFEARTMRQHLDVMLYPYRVAAALGSAFGLIALALAGIGLYGVFACGVTERLRELAIRLALGASPSRSFGPHPWQPSAPRPWQLRREG